MAKKTSKTAEARQKERREAVDILLRYVSPRGAYAMLQDMRDAGCADLEVKDLLSELEVYLIYKYPGG